MPGGKKNSWVVYSNKRDNNSEHAAGSSSSPGSRNVDCCQRCISSVQLTKSLVLTTTLSSLLLIISLGYCGLLSDYRDHFMTPCCIVFLSIVSVHAIWSVLCSSNLSKPHRTHTAWMPILDSLDANNIIMFLRGIDTRTLLII